jgi:hypothetical protein
MILLLTLSTAVALSATSYVCLRRDVRRNHPEIFRAPATIASLRLLEWPALELPRFRGSRP